MRAHRSAAHSSAVSDPEVVLHRFLITTAVTLAALVAVSLLVIAPATAEGVTAAQLQARGWDCFVPPPFPDTIVCGNPAEGLPPIPPGPNGRASYSFLLFDRASGDFEGTLHMIRADLYHGQPCPQTGGAYVFNPAIGYYRCGL
jgi:hypothetical protein